MVRQEGNGRFHAVVTTLAKALVVVWGKAGKWEDAGGMPLSDL